MINSTCQFIGATTDDYVKARLEDIVIPTIHHLFNQLSKEEDLTKADILYSLHRAKRSRR